MNLPDTIEALRDLADRLERSNLKDVDLRIRLSDHSAVHNTEGAEQLVHSYLDLMPSPTHSQSNGTAWVRSEDGDVNITVFYPVDLFGVMP